MTLDKSSGKGSGQVGILKTADFEEATIRVCWTATPPTAPTNPLIIHRSPYLLFHCSGYRERNALYQFIVDKKGYLMATKLFDLQFVQVQHQVRCYRTSFNRSFDVESGLQFGDEEDPLLVAKRDFKLMRPRLVSIESHPRDDGATIPDDGQLGSRNTFENTQYV